MLEVGRERKDRRGGVEGREGDGEGVKEEERNGGEEGDETKD